MYYNICGRELEPLTPGQRSDLGHRIHPGSGVNSRFRGRNPNSCGPMQDSRLVSCTSCSDNNLIWRLSKYSRQRGNSGLLPASTQTRKIKRVPQSRQGTSKNRLHQPGQQCFGVCQSPAPRVAEQSRSAFHQFF